MGQEARVIFSNQSAQSCLLPPFLYEDSESRLLLFIDLFSSPSVVFMLINNTSIDANGNKYVGEIMNYMEHIRLTNQILLSFVVLFVNFVTES